MKSENQSQLLVDKDGSLLEDSDGKQHHGAEKGVLLIDTKAENFEAIHTRSRALENYNDLTDAKIDPRDSNLAPRMIECAVSNKLKGVSIQSLDGVDRSAKGGTMDEGLSLKFPLGYGKDVVSKSSNQSEVAPNPTLESVPSPPPVQEFFIPTAVRSFDSEVTIPRMTGSIDGSSLDSDDSDDEDEDVFFDPSQLFRCLQDSPLLFQANSLIEYFCNTTTEDKQPLATMVSQNVSVLTNGRYEIQDAGPDSDYSAIIAVVRFRKSVCLNELVERKHHSIQSSLSATPVKGTEASGQPGNSVGVKHIEVRQFDRGQFDVRNVQIIYLQACFRRYLVLKRWRQHKLNEGEKLQSNLDGDHNEFHNIQEELQAEHKFNIWKLKKSECLDALLNVASQKQEVRSNKRECLKKLPEKNKQMREFLAMKYQYLDKVRDAGMESLLKNLIDFVMTKKKLQHKKLAYLSQLGNIFKIEKGSQTNIMKNT